MSSSLVCVISRDGVLGVVPGAGRDRPAGSRGSGRSWQSCNRKTLTQHQPAGEVPGADPAARAVVTLEQAERFFELSPARG